MSDEIDLPHAWEWRREELRASWRDALQQVSDLEPTGLLAQSMAADDFLLSLKDGRVAEVHVGYHAGADITFESLVVFDSLAAWAIETKAE